MSAPNSNAAQALAYIKKRLMAGEFRAGSRLTEEALARDLGISRTPVREAIRTLIADGFLRFKPNSGAYVAEWTDEDIRQIFELRTILEGRVAEAAALSIAPHELQALAAIQKKLDPLEDARGEEALRRHSMLNRKFHALIASASRKGRLAAALESAISMPIVHHTFRRYSAEQRARSLAHHRELLDAFRAHDPQWARAVMTSHIRAAMGALLPSQKSVR